MTKHTPEPWVIDERDDLAHNFYSDDVTGSIIGGCQEYKLAPRSRKERKANARRMVACVNALAGLTTEQIEDGVFIKMRDDRDFLAKQNADLLEVQNDHHRLVRELDVLLNGVDAAPQESLCDLVAKLKSKGGAA